MQSVLAPLIGPTVCVPPSLVGRTAVVTGMSSQPLCVDAGTHACPIPPLYPLTSSQSLPWTPCSSQVVPSVSDTKSPELSRRLVLASS